MNEKEIIDYIQNLIKNDEVCMTYRNRRLLKHDSLKDYGMAKSIID